MEQISVSPVFVGRGTETTALTAALGRAAAGQPQAVLIAGEAGVGKTRLLEEFLDEVCGEKVVIGLGGCLEVGAEGLPYAPLATALRRLYRRLGAELERAAEGMAGHLARLLPEFGETGAEPNDEFGRAQLFEHTTRLFERLSAERTIVLAIEDLHWSDRSTRELLAYLIRTLHRSRVLIVATYRSDDLHRRHPLRPFLAELDRLRTVQRLELARFGPGEVAAQLAGILGTETPDRELVDRIHRRSEGNPFFVEELAAAHQDGCPAGMTDSLRDILLVRVEALPDETQRVLRIAAEGGSYVEHALLAAVLDDGDGDGDAEEALIGALRTAVGANVLRPDTDGEGYRFRHALVREAVSDDLLPGERYRINRRYATVLEGDSALVCTDSGPARLANYWYHAHDPARALPTALDAARAARRRNAFAEQLRMLERALGLWDEVSEEVLATTLRPYDWAETYPPCSCDAGDHDESCDRLRLIDVLAEAVVAARRSGDPERGLSLSKRALKLVDEREDPERAAWFRMHRSRMLGHLLRAGRDEEIEHAQRLVAGLRPSAVQAEVFALAAAHAAALQPTTGDVALAERAVAIAREVGATGVEQHARMTLGTLSAYLGDPEAGVALLTDAVERTKSLGAPDLHCRGLNNLASLLLDVGRPAEAEALAREGLLAAGRTGLLANTGAILAGNLAEALIALGRPAEATEVLAEWDTDLGSGSCHEFLDRLRGELALERGDPAAAAAFLARVRQFGRVRQSQHELPNVRLAMRIAARAGRPLEARAELLAVLDARAARRREEGDRLPEGACDRLLPVLAEAAAIEADARGLPSAVPGRAAVLGRIAEVAARLSPRVPLHLGWARLLAGELARAEGADTPAHWAAAVAALRAVDPGYPLLLALYRSAEAAAVAGQRESAATLLREAHELAEARSDRELRREITRLAERAGLTLYSRPAAPVASGRAVEALGLTPRERDVLQRLALGRTNRQIAEELFISPKTASVHVSNILAKLAVGGRGEAAALAHRLRLFPEAELVPTGA
ncbi:AAA family ATPase [Kitasatospora sp. MAP5-34]|uniref:helix-turn-helix transcriptional regulator n=1 Tax=Kitasatospora sp. MAP5-34 TaxID=3035102 RepID=UPI0024740479|nr:AAA family ATPase [Kitasatospora sp. MAP5-34]